MKDSEKVLFENLVQRAGASSNNKNMPTDTTYQEVIAEIHKQQASAQIHEMYNGSDSIAVRYTATKESWGVKQDKFPNQNMQRIRHSKDVLLDGPSRENINDRVNLLLDKSDIEDRVNIIVPIGPAADNGREKFVDYFSMRPNTLINAELFFGEAFGIAYEGKSSRDDKVKFYRVMTRHGDAYVVHITEWQDHTTSFNLSDNDLLALLLLISS